jgi:hypothetical protein
MIPLIGGIPNLEPLQIAVCALPGYRQALETATAADQWLKEQPALPPVDPALRAAINDQWVDAERARETALAEHEARRKIVQTRLHEEANRAQSIFNTGIDLILGALQQDLSRILGDAERLVAQLDGASTATMAIAGDVGPAWQQLTELSDEYQTLRQAQQFVLARAPIQIWKSCTPELPGESHANQAYLKNIGELWRNWRQPGLRSRRINLSDNVTAVRDEPWPADSGPELLVWLVTSDAEPWCPTTKQLREMWNERPTADDKQPDDEQQDDESERYKSLLYGPLEVERKRQAAAAQRKKQQPDYTRTVTPISHKTPTRPAEQGAP